MKNIHVLPTSQPSRFSLKSSGKYHLTNQLHANSPNFTNQYIYITSSEEIKEGWHFNNAINVNKPVFVKSEDIHSIKQIYGDKPRHLEKIVLTIDQDLINDNPFLYTLPISNSGVQDIPDEFLEWFMNNPKCEEVEVQKEKVILGEVAGTTYTDFNYKIIIPKEQIISSEEDAKIFVNAINNPPEPNDELKEAFEKYANQEWEVQFPLKVEDCVKKAYLAGAEGQAEIMYSEKELFELTLNALDLGMRIRQEQLMHYSEKSGRESHKEWFEQFKKK
jgi:hypothetical protein